MPSHSGSETDNVVDDTHLDVNQELSQELFTEIQHDVLVCFTF